MDAIAPSPARPGPRAPSNANDEPGPTFDDHLADAETPPSSAPTHNKETPAETSAPAPATPDTIAAPVAAPAEQTPAAPVVLQVIAGAPAPPASAPSAEGAAPQAAPTPSTPAQIPVQPPETQKAAAAPSAPTPTQAAPETAATASAPNEATPTQTPIAETAKPNQTRAQAEPATPAPPTQPTTTPQPQTPAIVAPAVEQPQATQTATSPLPAAPIAPTTQAAPASRATAPITEGKPASENGKAAPAQSGAQNAGAKSVQSKTAAPSTDFSAFALSDAPEAPSQPAQNATALTTQSAASVQHASAVEQSAARAAPAGAQVSREIIRRFDGGATRFEMRLDPPELGRVEIRLEVTRDHRVTALISADNPQALTDLVRHARELEQSLQAAGLDLSDSGLSFDLRQGDESAREAGGGDGRGANDHAPGEDETALPQSQQTARLERWRGMRIDVMA